MRRDPFGKTPLLRLEADPESAFFGGAAPSSRGEPDPSAILDDMIWGHSIDPWRSMWTGVTRVPAGHEVGADGLIHRWYERPPVTPDFERGAHETLAQFRELLWASVERSVGAASEVAVSMSGGLDSCALAAIAVDLFGRERVHAVTASAAGDYDDPEPAIARRVARDLGISWTVIESGATPYCEAWDSSWLWPLQPSSSAMVAWDEAMPAVADGVCIWGLGGDSLLRGDTRYYRHLALQGRLVRILEDIASAMLIHGSRPGLHLLQGAATPELARPPVWLHPSKLALFESHAELRREHDASLATGLDELFDPYFAHVFERYSPMGPEGCRYVLPFFDVALVEFMATVPTVPWSLNKELLRAAMRGYLPDDVRLRPKTFAGPTTVTLSQDDVAMIEHWLSSEVLEQWVLVDRLESPLRAGRVPWDELEAITVIISLARWLETYA